MCRAFLLGGLLLLSPFFVQGQSLTKALLLVGNEVFPTLSQEDVEQLIGQGTEESLFEDIMGGKVRLAQRTDTYMQVVTDSTITDEFCLYPYQRKYILCHLHTVTHPILYTEVAFYDHKGKALAPSSFIPTMTGLDFLSSETDHSSFAFLSNKEFIRSLPLHYYLESEGKTLRAALDYLPLTTEEQKRLLSSFFTPQTIALQWGKKGFERIKE